MPPISVPQPPAHYKDSPETRLRLLWYFPIFLSVCIASIGVGYGFSDSFAMLYAAHHETLLQFARKPIEGGRPVYALLLWIGFSLTHSVHDLIYLRAFSVVSLALLAIHIHRTLRFTDLPQYAVDVAPVLMCTVPAFLVYASWAVAAFYPLAALLSAMAFQVIDESNNGQRASFRQLAAGFALLVTAMTIYQPAAMYYWVFAAIAWQIGKETVSEFRIAMAGVMMMLALAMDFVLSKILPVLIYTDGNTLTRTKLLSHSAGKAVWFIEQPLKDVLNWFNLEPNNTIAAIAALFVLCGFALYRRHDGRRGVLTQLGIVCALAVLSYLPNLIVAENWASYRTQAALSGLFVLYGMLAFIGWARTFSWEWAARSAAYVITAGVACWASYTILTEFAVPQIIDAHIVGRAVEKAARTPDIRRLILVTGNPLSTFAPYVRYDEFGILSSSVPWALKAMAPLLTDNVLADRHIQVQVVHRCSLHDARGLVVLRMQPIIRSYRSN